MKLRITQPGYHDQSGEPVAVGTVLTVKSDTVPASLLNKCEIVAEDPKGNEPVSGQKTAKRAGLEKQAASASLTFNDDATEGTDQSQEGMTR